MAYSCCSWAATSYSQVVEVVEEVFIIAKLCHVDLLVLQRTSIEWVMILCDLVSVLARSWHLDRTWPVGVNVAEAISQILKGSLRNVFGLVQANKEVNWSNTSLSSLLRHKEEIKALVTLGVLDKISINDGSRLWVLNLSSSSIGEHSLVDSLVDNDEGDWWWSTDLVIERFQS